jgi:hypothetical protein
MKNITTSSGLNLGFIEIFSTSFNKKYNYAPSKKDKIISLGNIMKDFFVDSINKENKYKETFGRNIIETLWPYLLKNTYNVYSIITGEKLSLKEINSSLLGYQSIDVPVYDSLGRFSHSKLITNKESPLNPSLFCKVQIQQIWYYNDSKNIVYNTIPYIILYAQKYNETEINPIIKIVFNN